MCGLFSNILPLMPARASRSIMEKALELASGGNPILTIQVMRVVEAIFAADYKPFYQKSELKEQNRHDNLCDQLLVALVNLKPHINDLQASQSFHKAVSRGYARLARVQKLMKAACSSELPKHYSMIAEALLSEKEGVVNSASAALCYLAKSCFTCSSLTVNGKSNTGAAASAMAMVNHSLSQAGNPNRDQSAKTPLEEILVILESLMGYRYKAVWKKVFKILRETFLALPQSAYVLLVPLLQAMEALHASDEVEMKGPLEEAFGAALQTMGPALFLEILPLNLPTGQDAQEQDSESFNNQLARARTWLLPVLKTHIRGQNSRLSYFVNEFMPLAESLLQQRVSAISEGKRSVEAKTLETISTQLWECFPSFCLLPTHLKADFKKTARPIAAVLENPSTKHLRVHVLKGLNLLISRNLQVAQSEGQEEKQESDNAALSSTSSSDSSHISIEEAKENTAFLANRAKNFLPILFNIMTKDTAPAKSVFDLNNGGADGNGSDADMDEEEDDASAHANATSVKEQILSLVAHFASIAPSQLVNTLFQRALKRMLEANIDSSSSPSDTPSPLSVPGGLSLEMQTQQQGLFDLVTALCSSNQLTSDNTQVLFEMLQPQLGDKDSDIQKRSYRLLATLCSSDIDFVAKQWRAIVECLSKSAVTCKAAALKTRLQSIKQLLHKVPSLLDQPEILSVLPQFLGEVILALKDQSRKTRDAAYDLLVSLGHRMMETKVDSSVLSADSQNTTHPLMSEYVCMLLGGLAGTSPHMQSAAILALARIVYEFRFQLPQETLTGILSTIVPLFKKKSREVIKSVLGFTKVSLLALNPESLTPFLDDLMQGLVLWANDGKNKFKQKVRVILELLLRKFGYDVLISKVPSSFTKWVSHIKKEKARTKRKKHEKWLSFQKAKGKTDEEIEAANNSSSKAKSNDYESVLYDDENDDDDNDNDDDMGRGKKRGGKDKAQDGKLWIRDDDVDFLGKDVVRHVVSSKPMQQQKSIAFGDGINEKDGKLFIRDEGKQQLLAAMDAEEGGAGQKRGMKRGRGRDEDGGRGNKRGRHYQDGASFKAKRAGGDSKRRGQHDPYAYVPMDPQMLNKRNRHKTNKTFENVVRAAQRGSAAGIKIHTKNRLIKSKRANKKHKR